MRGESHRTMGLHTGALRFIIVFKPLFVGVVELRLINAPLGFMTIIWVHSRGWEREKVEKVNLNLLKGLLLLSSNQTGTGHSIYGEHYSREYLYLFI